MDSITPREAKCVMYKVAINYLLSLSIDTDGSQYVTQGISDQVKDELVKAKGALISTLEENLRYYMKG